MKKTVHLLVLSLVSMTTLGCSHPSDHVTFPTETTKPLSAESLVSGSTWAPLASLVPDSKVHSINNFPEAVVQGYLDNSGFFVPIWDYTGADPTLSSPLTDGLYFVSSKTNSVLQVVSLDAKSRQQVNKAVCNTNWLVWQEGKDDNSGSYVLKAENLKTHKIKEIYRVPQGYQAANDPSLDLDNNTLYWSNFVDGKTSVLSQVSMVNLLTGDTRTLVKYVTSDSASSLRNTGIIVSSTLVGKNVIFSVHESGQIYNTAAKGALYSVNPVTRKIALILPLFHVADQLASSGNTVVFTTNYSAIPNGPAHAGPYPIYLYQEGSKTVDQVTINGAGVGFPSVSNRYVSWFGAPGDPQLYDRKTHIYYAIKGSNVRIFGNTLFWNSGRTVYWCQLPQ